MKFVSRGGLKLERPWFWNFVKCSPEATLDIGASTGGFLMSHVCKAGAKSSLLKCQYTNRRWQPLETWKAGSGVISIEQFNFAFNIAVADFEQIPQFANALMSAIFLWVYTCLENFGYEEGRKVLAIKPQFEAGREQSWQERYRQRQRSPYSGLRKGHIFMVELGFSVAELLLLGTRQCWIFGLFRKKNSTPKSSSRLSRSRLRQRIWIYE